MGICSIKKGEKMNKYIILAKEANDLGIDLLIKFDEKGGISSLKFTKQVLCPTAELRQTEPPIIWYNYDYPRRDKSKRYNEK